MAAADEGKPAPERSSSYRYWVRETKQDAVPLPAPRKLSAEELAKQNDVGNGYASNLGSVWNQAGTWEEKNLNSWASNRLKELLSSIGNLEFSNGKACIDEVSNCSGDAFSVTVRNKKRVGYTYELGLKFRGEWSIKQEAKKVKGYLDVSEFSFGELEDLQVQIRINDDKDLDADDKTNICMDLKSFLSPIREKLQKFEEELKDR